MTDKNSKLPPAPPPDVPPHTPRFARTRRLALSLVTMYLMVILVFSLLQTWLIFPGAQTQNTPDAHVTPPPGTTLIPLSTPSGHHTFALFGPALLPDDTPSPHAQNLPTLLYFYGNGMCLADTFHEFRDFRRLGANVLIVEYVGYGMADGSPGEQSCYESAEAAYQHLLNRRDIDAHKIIPAGWSLGAAVAIDLAHRHRTENHIAGIITFSAFTSLTDIAQKNYPFLPLSLFLKHRFESARKLQEGVAAVPMLIGHGRLDAMIPFAMSQSLVTEARRSGSVVTELPISQANHNDFYVVGEDQILPTMQKFIVSVGGP